MKRPSKASLPSAKAQASVAVIGGSGLYAMEGLSGIREISVATPFGKPSDRIILGSLEGTKIAFLSRHGRGHLYSPSEINYRANIWALKKIGVQRILSVSAVGSMKEGIRPGDIVVPHQFYDHTKRRVSSFFGGGLVAHIPFSDPVCPELSSVVADAGRAAGGTVHAAGVYLCIEGPQFSTRAESEIYRRWGVDVIGMTNVTEAKLAREAEICYATIALATDYDCWHAAESPVTVEAVLAVLKANVEFSKRLIRAAVPKIPAVRRCPCKDALANAFITDPKRIGSRIKKALAPLIGRYLS